MKEKEMKGAERSAPQRLDDERRVRVLSPGMLVVKRFLQNRLAIAGLVIITAMFLFSFAGGLLHPYGETQVFQIESIIEKAYASAAKNTNFYYTVKEGMPPFGNSAQAASVLAYNSGKDYMRFESQGTEYSMRIMGDDFYTVSILNVSGTQEELAMASKTIFDVYSPDTILNYEFKLAAENAKAADSDSFTVGGRNYTVTYDSTGGASVLENGHPYCEMSDMVVTSTVSGTFLPMKFKNDLKNAVKNGDTKFESGTDENGNSVQFRLERNDYQYTVKAVTATALLDIYAKPSSVHWLGTDGHGMDILVRLMYGGRISLIIGFIVVLIETIIGITVGGISGYFGGWADTLLMRAVDIMNCIPTLPLFIILGVLMDSTGVAISMRIYYLVLIMGITGWPGIARVVRGQILSLREQEFMTAAEAAGISVRRKIFRHLIPNVIPQLIVYATMGLGGVILSEATLSFLGLGVKFPYASWGSMINAVNDSFVMSSYLFVWIPAGLLILLTVLGFNFIGDGLRDAFDPKMKR